MGRGLGPQASALVSPGLVPGQSVPHDYRFSVLSSEIRGLGRRRALAGTLPLPLAVMCGAGCPTSRPHPPLSGRGRQGLAGARGRKEDPRRAREEGSEFLHTHPVCTVHCCYCCCCCCCRLFFIDKAGEEMTEEEQQRLDQRAQRFAVSGGNRNFKKRLSVAELLQAAVSSPCHMYMYLYMYMLTLPFRVHLRRPALGGRMETWTGRTLPLRAPPRLWRSHT